MSEILHADIFFFITAIAVVCVSVGALVVLYYFARILRDISILTHKLRSASDQIEKDVASLRTGILHEGTHLRKIIGSAIGLAIASMYNKHVKKKKRKAEPK